MRLRPYAPLAVVGAGLMIIVVAPFSASAQDASAPVDVLVTPSGADLLVTWQAPSTTDGLTDYDLTVTGSSADQRLLQRTLAVGATQARISPADLDGHTDVVVTLSSDYGSSTRFAAPAVQVTLPDAPGKPEAAPKVSVEGRTLTVRLPAVGDAGSGEVMGRVVRLYRDDSHWRDVTLPATRSTVKRKVEPGHTYAAAYQVLAPAAESPFSEQSESIKVQAGTVGPTAVSIVRLKSVVGGLQVRWKAAVAQGADLDSYRVRVSKAGERVGSAYTAAAVRTVLLPSDQVERQPYTVTVTAKDAAGGTSSSTLTVTPKG